MSKFVHSGDTNIYYQVRGAGAPLMLIMGFGADGNLWEKHVQEYQKHFTCYLIDNRGVGESGQPKGPYTTKQMAEDVIAVMDHAGVQNAAVAGISMGGAIAQQLALNHPDRVRSLALISTWSRFNAYATTIYENLKKIRATSKPGVFMELLQLWIFGHPFYESSMSDLVAGQANAANNRSPQTKEGFDGQLDACIHHNVFSRLSEINVPTLITVGDLDIFTPPAFSKELHAGISGSTYVNFPTGGHVHHWEDLERFNRVTTEFFLKN